MFSNVIDIYNFFVKHPNISIDSRTTKKSDIFFSIKGDRFDGNQFASKAIKKGAIAAFIDDKKYISEHSNIFYVNNCLDLLQDLASIHRTKLNKPIIAITGTNGKTTTRHLISFVLENKFNIHTNFSNYNNHIGVPLTLLSIKDDHDIVVLELAASKVGDIDFLCNISKPNYGYITNFGKAHLNEFKNFNNIVKTKLELYDYLRDNAGEVFVNIDDEIQVSNSKGIKSHFFGKKAVDFKIEPLEYNFFVDLKYGDTIVNSKIYGLYNFYNISAAIVIGKYFGVDDDSIKKSIERIDLSKNRSQIIKIGSNLIVLDAYNSNPSSLKEAINNFLKLKGKKIIFIGDMLDLGDSSNREHLKFIEIIKDIDIENVFVVGKIFSSIDTKYSKKVKSFIDVEECKKFIYKTYRDISQTNILIKGSRSIKMEDIVDIIKKVSK